MLLVLMQLIFYLCIRNCKALETCSNVPQNRTTFVKSGVVVPDRYKSEWCVTVNPDYVSKYNSLLLWIEYVEASPETCLPRLSGTHESHSNLNDVIKLQNCTNKCFINEFDLIFDGCYCITKTLMGGNAIPIQVKSWLYISNGIKNTTFTRSKVIAAHNGTQISLTWYSGKIPLTDYKMFYCKNAEEAVREDISKNCTQDNLYRVRCIVNLPYGSYVFSMEHFAPWVAAEIFSDLRIQHYKYNHTLDLPNEPVDDGRMMRTVLWVCGGAGIVLIVIGIIAYLLRMDHRAARGKMIEDAWVNRYKKPMETSVTVGTDNGLSTGSVLLLYARDCDAATRAVAALRTLIEGVAQGQVYDIASTKVQTLAASAPGEWIEGLIQDPRVRIVLLLTPAAALYRTVYLDEDDGYKLDTALLGSRVMYRKPQYSDVLLLYALRVLRDAAHRQSNYNKYFIAHVEGLPEEEAPDIVPAVAPFTRYALPSAAPALIRDLSPVPPTPAAATDLPDQYDPADFAELNQALTDLRELVARRPDYLKDELMFI